MSSMNENMTVTLNESLLLFEILPEQEKHIKFKVFMSWKEKVISLSSTLSDCCHNRKTRVRTSMSTAFQVSQCAKTV